MPKLKVDKQAFEVEQKKTKTSKQAFKVAKKKVKLTRDSYRLAEKQYQKEAKPLTTEEKSTVEKKKQVFQQSVEEKKESKRLYKQQKKADPSTVRNQVKKEAKVSFKRSVNNQLSKELREEDTLREGVDRYRTVKYTEQRVRMGKETARKGSALLVRGAKSTYGLGNRFMNFSRGRGFQRTPTDETARKKSMIQLRNRSHRLKAAMEQKKAEAGLRLAEEVFKGKQTMKKALQVIFTNPITWGVLVFFFVCLAIFGVTVSTQKPSIVQEEKPLTESWLYVTELDAKESDTQNIFYTDVDSLMFYMNYRFDDYTLWEMMESGVSNYALFLDQLWTELNGTAPDYSLKTMSDLETDESSGYSFSEEEYEHYKELREELGYSPVDGQLTFPYETDTLIVARRFGYERQGEQLAVHDSIEALIPSQTDVRAPMDGTLTSLGEDKVEITQEKESRLTVSGLDLSRWRKGDTVSEGEYLGKMTQDTLTIQYERFLDGEWSIVNPSFYFPHVTYLQTTILGSSDFSPDSEVEKRAQVVYDYLLNLGYTRAGICAILGNFSVESGINSKRAEGDYLAPPVGASATSWDDPKWLSMGGIDIYGKYPNIVHRGLGLGQWTDTLDGSTRHTLLRNFADAKKKKWYDLELQLDFMLNGDVPAAQTHAKNTAGSSVATTVPELTVYFLNYWEGNPGDKVNERIQEAQNWYAYFSSSNQDLNQSSQEVFNKYKEQMKPLPTDKETKQGQGWSGNAYALGNCTWYVYNRMAQLGKPIHPTMGNANQWVTNYSMTPGATLVTTPKRGDVVIFTDGVAGTSPIYGHVAVVEHVNSDGTFVISEMNIQGEYSMGYRVLKKQAGETFMRVPSK